MSSVVSIMLACKNPMYFDFLISWGALMIFFDFGSYLALPWSMNA